MTHTVHEQEIMGKLLRDIFYADMAIPSRRTKMTHTVDTRTAGDIHQDEQFEKLLDLREEIGRLKSQVDILTAENETLKALIANARITRNDATGKESRCT